MDNIPSKEAEIPRVINHLANDVERLSETLDNLFGRILCICNSDPPIETRREQDTSSLQSSLAIKIDEIRTNVANLVDRIQERISRLEL